MAVGAARFVKLLFFRKGNMVADNVVLQVEGLCFAYPECGVLNQWSVALPAGLALVRGDESSGKTTLLRLLAGDLAAQQGRLVLRGVDGAADPDGYRQQVFWQDPRAHALHDITGNAWLATLPARYPAWSASALAAHVQGWGLAVHLVKPIYQLSSGSQRKLLMAAALASGAALTLIDEPIAGLDRPSTLYLQQALTNAAQSPSVPPRAIVVAHYEALDGVPLQQVLDLPD